MISFRSVSRSAVSTVVLALGATVLAAPLPWGDGLSSEMWAQAGPIDSITEASLQLGVDSSLVEKSVEISDYAGELEQELRSHFPEHFSAVSIDVRTSEISVFGMKHNGENLSIQNFLDGLDHPHAVSYTESETTERERAILASSVRRELDRDGIAADIHGSAYSDTVIVEIARGDLLAARASALDSRLEELARETLALKPSDTRREFITVTIVDQLALPVAVARGGNWLSSCTAGLPLVNSSGTRFLSTSGHCTDPQHVTAPSSINTTTVSSHFSGSRDIKIMSLASGHSVGKGLRYKNSAGNWLSQSVDSIKTRSSLTLGSIVCKAGKTTPTSCGTVQTKTYLPSYMPNGSATFIHATAVSAGGDSGGPVFLQGTAFGLTSGSTGAGQLIFQSVSYIPSGYSVLTT